MSLERTALEHFKKGGRGFTFSEWSALTAEEQTMAIEVESEVQHQKAAMIAYFLLNPKAMFDALGGEDAMIRAVLEGIVK